MRAMSIAGRPLSVQTRCWRTTGKPVQSNAAMCAGVRAAVRFVKCQVATLILMLVCKGCSRTRRSLFLRQNPCHSEPKSKSEHDICPLPSHQTTGSAESHRTPTRMRISSCAGAVSGCLWPLHAALSFACKVARGVNLLLQRVGARHRRGFAPSCVGALKVVPLTGIGTCSGGDGCKRTEEFDVRCCLGWFAAGARRRGSMKADVF